MNKFIEITHSKSKLLINTDHIIKILRDENKNCYIYFTNGSRFEVSEQGISYDTLYNKIKPLLEETAVKNLSKVAGCDCFICSKCGIHLEEWSRYVYDEDREETYCYEYTFNFCPNCGHKIEGE